MPNVASYTNMWSDVSLESDMSRTPSLGRSDESVGDGASIPATPFEISPLINAQTYTIPMGDVGSLMSPPSQRYYTALPDIMNPSAAASVSVRHICCVGAGYVGGPTAAMIALHNPSVRVTVVDRDEKRIQAWQSKHLPIHEPGLAEIVRVARDGTAAGRQPNLFFSSSCTQVIAEADMILISVNTPTKLRGLGAGRATDMMAFEGAVRDIAIHSKPGTILVEKSTVPCRTGQLVKDIMEAHRPGAIFPVLSNPEFLAEGTAIRDLMKPDRVVIGCESTISGHRAAAALANLYAAWIPRSKILPTNIWSSELCKLTANAMLAQRISSINSISAICEKTGADVGEIAKSIGMDTRIGPQFLKAGLGFGGSCFRKDVASLTYLAESLGLPEVAAYWQQVLVMNNFQRDRFARQVISTLNNSLRGKKIAILGYAFKKDTSDAREAPAMDVIRLLLNESPRTVAIFDPLCREADIKRELRALGEDEDVQKPTGPVQIFSDPYEACENSNAILVLTEWDMFKNSKAATALPTKPSEENSNLSGATPATILHSRTIQNCDGGDLPISAEVRPDQQRPQKTTQREHTSFLPLELSKSLLPEPNCPSNCVDCDSAAGLMTNVDAHLNIALDWQRISQSVKEPRWVFDGRNILESEAMTTYGFRLETLGRASIY